MSQKASLTKDDILHIANLANLSLSEEEIIIFQTQLTDILSYVVQLNELDTKDTPQTNQITGLTNVYREDNYDPEYPLTIDEVLSNAKKTKDNMFKVPAISKK